MRKNGLFKRLLSLLLCLSMFLSLGFTAYAQPNEKEQEAAQGQILPVEDSAGEQGEILPAEAETEQEPVLPAETEAEGPSFTPEQNPLFIEQPGRASVVITVRDLVAGTVSGYTPEGEYVENMQATKLRMYDFNGFDGVLTDTNGSTMPFYVLDSNGQRAESVLLGSDFVIGTSTAFGFTVNTYFWACYKIRTEPSHPRVGGACPSQQ